MIFFLKKKIDAVPGQRLHWQTSFEGAAKISISKITRTFFLKFRLLALGFEWI